MAKYRKKPVVVEAVQWFAQSCGEDEVVQPYHGADREPGQACGMCGGNMVKHGMIGPPEAAWIVCPGDWIITSAKGKHGPCKPDIFEQTYEPAGETQPVKIVAVPCVVCGGDGKGPCGFDMDAKGNPLPFFLSCQACHGVGKVLAPAKETT